MTMEVVEVDGPSIDRVALKDRVSFRFIQYYYIATDSIICRLDVKVGSKQKGKMFHISQPPIVNQLDASSPLQKAKGVISSEAMIAERMPLARALRELAEHLEKSE